MEQYILAHDLGTSANKAVLYTLDGKLVKSTVYPYELLVPGPNRAEQRGDDWWKAVCETTKILLEEIPNTQIAAVSFSGQMMGCLCVDDHGTPLHNALIWADMRPTEQAGTVRAQIDPMEYYHMTGHRISPSYSCMKLMWLRDHIPEVYERTYKMLNAKDYILFKLTGNFVSEPSDASSTCLMDLNKREWSDTLLHLTGLSRDKLPDLIRSVDRAGVVTKQAAKLTGLLEGTPVICGGGDACCAAVGAGVIEEGIANCSMGTSSWISVASRTPICDSGMTVINWAHIIPDYILPNGTMQTGGGALSWAVDTLFRSADGSMDSDKSAIYRCVNAEVGASPLGAKDMLFLPYLMGERSPRWTDHAKGAFVGLTIDHKRGDILRAVMEGVGYNLDIILRILLENGCQIDDMILTGGGARNAAWRRILSDIFGVSLSVPVNLEEATSVGAVVTAGVGIGAYDDFRAVNRFLEIQSREYPNGEAHAAYQKQKDLFEETYQRLFPLFEKM